jgi:hypothetical protein
LLGLEITLSTKLLLPLPLGSSLGIQAALGQASLLSLSLALFIFLATLGHGSDGSLLGLTLLLAVLGD